MKVQDLMSTDVASCSIHSDIAGAAVIMWERDCGILPVTDGRRVVGVITDRDVCMAAATRDRPASAISVGDVIAFQEALHTVGPEDSLATALERMARAQVRRLPVVAGDGALEGMLSLNDVILAAQNVRAGSARVSYESVLKALQEVSRHRPPGAVEPLPEDAAPARRPRAPRTRRPR